MQEVAVEFTAGNIAGWSFITMGMPLDLLKTTLQLNRPISLQLCKNLIKQNQGFCRTFYKGASSMYLFFGLATALEFTVFQTAIQALSGFSMPREVDLFAGGFLAGLSSSLIYTPIEFAKIKAQTDPQIQSKGSARRMFEILARDKVSGLRQIYTGLPLTVMRQAFGLGIYYGGFHMLMLNLFKQTDRQKAKLSSQVGSAIISGLFYNLWGYPFDTFKTNVQNGKYRLVRDMVTDRFWQQKSFKQGMGLVLLKGLLIDSSNLIVYERSRNFAEQFLRCDLFQ